MKMSGILAAAAAASLAAAPVAAAPASPVAPSAVRAGTAVDHQSDLAGGSGLLIGLVALILVVITVAIVASNDDKPRSP